MYCGFGYTRMVCNSTTNARIELEPKIPKLIRPVESSLLFSCVIPLHLGENTFHPVISAETNSPIYIYDMITFVNPYFPSIFS